MKEKFQFIIENQNLESTDPDLEQSLNELQHCTTASSSKSESFTMDMELLDKALAIIDDFISN